MSPLSEWRQDAGLRIKHGALAVTNGVDHHKITVGEVEVQFAFAMPRVAASRLPSSHKRRRLPPSVHHFFRMRASRCPNLLAEAELYCYTDDPRERHAEIPIDEHKHALAALRYLIMGIGPSRRRSSSSPDTPPKPKRPWLRYDNEALWTSLG